MNMCYGNEEVKIQVEIKRNQVCWRLCNQYQLNTSFNINKDRTGKSPQQEVVDSDFFFLTALESS